MQKSIALLLVLPLQLVDSRKITLFATLSILISDQIYQQPTVLSLPTRLSTRPKTRTSNPSGIETHLIGITHNGDLMYKAELDIGVDYERLLAGSSPDDSEPLAMHVLQGT